MKLLSKELSAKLLVLALVLGVTACASNSNSEDDAEDAANAAGADSSVSTSGSDDGDVSTSVADAGSDASAAAGELEANALANAELLQQTEFMFDFDSFSVAAADEEALRAHGKFLSKTSIARVRVEGHTDEQGTREYNLALGERRAKAVKQILMSEGAKSGQIEVITFGEERPKANGSDEGAYSQNRRAEIEYTVGRP